MAEAGHYETSMLSCQDVEDMQNAQEHNSDQVQQAYQRSTGSVWAIQLRSPESGLRNDAVTLLERHKLQSTWLAFVPAYTGRRPELDRAIMRLSKAYSDYERPHTINRDLQRKSYSRAMADLSHLLADSASALSDEALLATELLAHTEKTRGLSDGQQGLVIPHFGPVFSHYHGVHALLMARGPQKLGHLADLRRAIFSAHCCSVFAAACACGVPSPLDPAWIGVPARSWQHLPADVQLLRDMSQELLIRLPRLVTLVRILRRNKCRSQSPWLAAARSLSADLLRLCDIEAEQHILDRASLKTTSDLANALLTPVSYEFRDLIDYEACILYWQARIHLLRLYHRLPQDQTSGPGSLLPASYKIDAVRCARNIAMSWEYATAHSTYGKHRMSFAIPALWGTLQDFGTFAEAWLPVAEVRKWLFVRFHAVLRIMTEEERGEELDCVADVLAGGELRGAMVEELQASWSSLMRGQPGAL